MALLLGACSTEEVLVPGEYRLWITARYGGFSPEPWGELRMERDGTVHGYWCDVYSFECTAECAGSKLTVPELVELTRALNRAGVLSAEYDLYNCGLDAAELEFRVGSEEGPGRVFPYYLGCEEQDPLLDAAIDLAVGFVAACD